MDNMPAKSLNDYPLGRTSRRKLLWTLGAAAVGAPFASFTVGQGHCRDGYGTQSCPLNAKAATAPIKPVFAPTGWKTLALDHITFQMPDYRKEAAFYIALMEWKLRSDDGKQAVLDLPPKVIPDFVIAKRKAGVKVQIIFRVRYPPDVRRASLIRGFRCPQLPPRSLNLSVKSKVARGRYGQSSRRDFSAKLRG